MRIFYVELLVERTVDFRQQMNINKDIEREFGDIFDSNIVIKSIAHG
jgi:hypothetical protein